MLIGPYRYGINVDWSEYLSYHKCYKRPHYMFNTQSELRPGSDTNHISGVGILRALSFSSQLSNFKS